MANWLQKILTNVPTVTRTNNLPATVRNRPPAVQGGGSVEPRLPPASIVYGVAAAVLFAVALCFFIKGAWFTGFIVLLPAGAMLGFALHFIKAQ